MNLREYDYSISQHKYYQCMVLVVYYGCTAHADPTCYLTRIYHATGDTFMRYQKTQPAEWSDMVLHMQVGKMLQRCAVLLPSVLDDVGVTVTDECAGTMEHLQWASVRYWQGQDE